MICFIHLPKTSGSYINALFKLNSYKCIDHIEEELFIGKNFNCLDFKNINFKIFKDIDYLSGHFNYLNFKKLSKLIKKDFLFFSLVRNPIDRIFSKINYMYTNIDIFLSNERSISGLINRYNIYHTYFLLHNFLHSKPEHILESSIFYKFNYETYYSYFYKDRINYNFIDILEINKTCKKIETIFKGEIKFFDNENLNDLKKSFNLKQNLKDKVNVSKNFIDYTKIDPNKFFEKSFKYIYLDLIFYYYFKNKKANLFFNNKNEFVEFFKLFFSEIFPDKKENKISKIKKIIKINFDKLVIRSVFKEEYDFYKKYGSINKLKKKQIQFNKIKNLPPDFDLNFYNGINLDVSSHKIDPCIHYKNYGFLEHRLISDHDYIYNEELGIVIERFVTR